MGQKGVKGLFAVGVALLVLAGTGYTYIFLNKKPTDFSASAATCTVDAKLVNSCRPWLGGTANFYGQSGWKAHILDLEARTGKQLDMVHKFNTFGQNTISADAKFFVDRPNTILLQNWKPASDWASGGGGNASVNAGIDTMADSVKSLGSKKIILAVWHEPNNDVTNGASGCPSNYNYKGNSGTPAQYRAMWQNVRNRFDAKGVTNVVWAIIYQSDDSWDCMQKDLYPGNNLVDWVMWDHYYNKNETWATGTSRFYNWLTNNSDATHNFNSKPWGIGEWGSWADTQTKAKQLYIDAGNSLKAGEFPKIKAYNLWDSNGTNDSRIAYTINGVSDPSEQTTYATNFAQNSVFVDGAGGGGGGGTPDTTQPTASITSPSGGSTVSGIITVSASASDNVGVTKVDFSIDGTIFATDTSSPYSVSWDSKTVANGSHTLRAKAWDAAGNAKTPLVNITVSNAAVAPVITSFSASPASVVVGATTTLSWATTGTSSCSIPGGPTNTTLKSWSPLAFTSTGTKTYTLTCQNSEGATTSKSTSVSVAPAPVPPSNVSLAASSTSVTAGTSVLLSWSSSGSTSCTLNPGNFTASGTTSSRTVTVSSTTAYSVTCQNNAGSTTSNTVTLTVTATPQPAKPSIIAFSAVPTNVASGGTAILSWQTTNVATSGCSLSPSPLTTAAASGSWTTGALTSSISYTLTCKNSANEVTSKSLAVTVNKAPAPPAPPPSNPSTIGAPPSSPTVTAPTGQQVVNTQATGQVTQGELASLDTSTVTDERKVESVIKVEFYNGEELIQTVTQAPFVLDTTALPAGEYTITQRTYFDDGSSAEQSQLIEVKGATAARGGEASLPSGWPLIGGLFALLFAVVVAVWWFVLRPQGYSVRASFGYVGLAAKQLLPWSGNHHKQQTNYDPDTDAIEIIRPNENDSQKQG